MNQYLKTTLSAFSGAILGALLIFYLTDSKQEMIMEDSAIST